MDISDLIGIGKLGGRDSDGYYHLMVKPSRWSAVAAIKDCYLIFTSDRVFYVTISDVKESQGRYYVRFVEDGIDEERPLHKEVILAIEPETLSGDDKDDEMDDLIGFQVVQGDLVIGTVCDYFDNTAQYILVIKSANGREVMIPYVDHYIVSVLSDLKTIIVQNAEPLLVI